MSAWWQEGGDWSAPFPVSGSSSATPGVIKAVVRRADTLDVFWVTPMDELAVAQWQAHHRWTGPVTINAPGSTAPAGVTAKLC